MATDMTGWLQAAAIIVASMLAVYFMVKQAKEVEKMQRRLHAPVRRYTIIELSDGTRIERKYADGDYVGKKVTTDKGPGVIVGIYGVKEEPESKGKKQSRGGVSTVLGLLSILSLHCLA